MFLFAFAAIAINLYCFNKYTKYFFLAMLIYLSHEVIHHEWIQIRAGLVSALVLPQIHLISQKKVQVVPCALIAGFFDSLPRDSVRFIAVSKSQVQIKLFDYLIDIRINVQVSRSNDNPNRYLGSPRSSSGSC